MSSPLKKELKNINIDTVENCNLLCKLVMDYMTTNTCVIEPVDSEGKSATSASNSNSNSFRISYPEGSFINYRDTNYELTYAYFFYPSRHSIDGERYDLEVNLYHGNFKDGTDGTKDKGLVAHTHYHNDTAESNLHKHFHYHLNDDGTSDNSSAHTGGDAQHTEKNIVTCLLYNMGKHTGSDVNIFFNQFIHHPDFKKLKSQTTVEKINITVHDNWAIEQIYPKKRSYFMYDEDKNTYVIFDTIQTISKEIIDRLYERGIKGATGIKGDTGFDINNLTNYTITNATNVLYRKNIEVITDEQYKKSTRAQIKDLLSLTRMSTYKPSKRTTKEYNYISENITKSISGGSNTGYQTNEEKAKRVADMWEIYGTDLPIEKKFTDFINTDFSTDVFIGANYKKYNNLGFIYDYYKETINSFDKGGDKGDTVVPAPSVEDSFKLYIAAKKSIYDKLKTFFLKNKDNSLFDEVNKSDWDTLLKFCGSDLNIVKIRIFFEELDLKFNSDNEIDTNLIQLLNRDGIIKTLKDVHIALIELNKPVPKPSYIDKLIFLEKNEPMIRTLSNEECQNWLSSEVHMEGDLWKFWEKPPEMKKNAELLFKHDTDPSLTPELRSKIGEGMIKYEGDKWKTHNECRNPGNTGSAPWCYTKNPNKRWEYCSKPVYSDKWGKFVLFLIFIFLGVIAYLTIKTFYLHEYPMKWVASLTGGTFASKETFAGQAGTGASTGTGKGGVAPKTK